MSTRPSSDLAARDARVAWHPYTQHGLEETPLAVVSARDEFLQLADGTVLVDAISSWWTSLHGHARPELVEALRAQAATLDHVLFAGATHEPAVQLAERLVELAPRGLTRVFYSDDGSTAVEVALKIALQAHVQRGEPNRRVFVALEHGYHGDTFGAMSAGDPDPFFRAFAPLLFRVERVAPNAAALARCLDELGAEAAGVLIEPLVQGAGGMRFHAPEFVRDARELCDRARVPLIADEVMTGFGRTGKLFACEHADVTPDLMCLAKGLTGGIFPLAVTLAREEWFESFRSRDRSRAFFHGHSFTASPLGCACALASLAIVLEENVPVKLNAVGARIAAGLRAHLGARAEALSLRHLGGIVALDLPSDRPGYLSGDPARLRRAAVERGVLLRPLGNVLYALPPACTSDASCDAIVAALAHVVELAASN